MRLARQLWFQVLVAMAAGAMLGYARPDFGVVMQPLGDLFVNLIRMIIGPVIFCTVVHGIAAMNDMKRVGRVALKALIWFEAVTLAALVFALVGVNLWQPGAGMNIDPSALDANSVRSYAAAAQHQTFSEFLLHIVPSTFVSAFAQGDVLQVLFVSVLFAFALALIGEPAKPVLDVIGRLSQIFFRIVGLIMWVAPIGAFGALAFTVGRFGASSLLSLGGLIVEFYVVCLAFVLIVLGGVARALGVSMFRLLYY
ncbi:MAG TPA: cation:dicarboxylase symporter family transporter, partial [Micropepsaceae bacterium]